MSVGVTVNSPAANITACIKHDGTPTLFILYECSDTIKLFVSNIIITFNGHTCISHASPILYGDPHGSLAESPRHDGYL